MVRFLKQLVAFFFGLLIAVAVLCVPLKLAWGWAIPAIAPGAVEQGLVVGNLGWIDSLKVAILVCAVLYLISALIQLSRQPLGKLLGLDEFPGIAANRPSREPKYDKHDGD